MVGPAGDAAVRAEAEAAAGSARRAARGDLRRLDRRDRRAPCRSPRSWRRCRELQAALEPARLARGGRDRDPHHRHLRQGQLCARPIGDAEVTIAGIAKGSGMIQPDMATMLAFLFTDARAAGRPAAAAAGGRPTSARSTRSPSTATPRPPTRCCCSRPARRAHPAPARHRTIPLLAGFRAALDAGADRSRAAGGARRRGREKLIDDRGRRRGERRSRRAGSRFSIANSPLVKTAIAGEDANWGRLAMAIGKAGEPVEPARLAISFGGHADRPAPATALSDLRRGAGRRRI